MFSFVDPAQLSITRKKVVGIFLWVFGQKICHFLAGFDQSFVFRTQHIPFHCIIIIIIIMDKVTDDVGIAVLRNYDLIKPLSNQMLECSFLFLLVQKV